MVLDAVEQAIWTRKQEGVLDLKDVVHHTDRGSQYTSIRFSDRLAEANARDRPPAEFLHGNVCGLARGRVQIVKDLVWAMTLHFRSVITTFIRM